MAQVTQLQYFDWLIKVEELITTAIASCHPRDWKEDLITYSWLKSLRDNIPSVSIQGFTSPFAVAWDAYKANRKLEQQYGDIAVLVELRFGKRKSLRGVAFLEAKRSYPAGYQALKWAQLAKQSAAVNNHRLLLYNDRLILLQEWAVACCPPWCPWPLVDTRAVAAPTRHALSLRSRSRKLHGLGVPLSFQLCTRYLRGLDLEYSQSLVSDVERGVAGGIRFLLVASVSAAEGIEPLLQRWRVNRRRYDALRTEG